MSALLRPPVSGILSSLAAPALSHTAHSLQLTTPHANVNSGLDLFTEQQNITAHLLCLAFPVISTQYPSGRR